jgi:tetratricopeptide (TPR) repeat protein
MACASWSRILVFVAALVALPATAEPYVPASGDVVVERLRDRPLDRTDRELRQWRAALRRSPEQLPIALAVAQQCIAIARRDGDPRYTGYAQAALAPWWHRADAPVPVRLLKAIVLQSVHAFDPALTELQGVLQTDPGNSQAWLTRASIYQVQGRYDAAQGDCRRLDVPATAVYAQVCLAELQSLQGSPDPAYRQLEEIRAQRPDLASWLHLVEAELSERRGDVRAADGHYRAALAGGGDSYAKGAYADFLLDHGRAADVIGLLQGGERVDPLLLRLALAYAALGDARAAAATADLQARFDAARLRGDTVHRREEARFTLDVLHQPERALDLALEDWQVQKEPADARIVLRAARASKRDEQAAAVRQFLAANVLPDVRLDPYR